MATLTWQRQDGRSAVFQLQGLETLIGREPGVGIRLDSTYVSKRHAVIRLTQQGYVVADLNSSNGTFVNGQRVSMAVLKDGDQLALGSEALAFANQTTGTAAAAGGAFGTASGAKRRGPVIFLVGGGGVVVLLLIVLILAGRSGEEGTGATGNAGTPDAISTPPGQVPTAAPTYQPETYPPPSGSAPPAMPPTHSSIDVPAGADANALYENAIVHVKGGRLVEARRLLQQAAALDPTNAMILQRLREVEATIQVRVDQHLANGTRAFTYLRYQDALIEWEQVIAMTEPSDPRYQQATAGMVRAKQRLGQPIR